MLGVCLAHPVFGDPRVVERLAERELVQVRLVGGDPAAELRGVADASVPGDHLADAGDGGQAGQAGAVVAHRVVGDGVEQRDLRVGDHVADGKDADLGQEDRAVAGGVRVVHDQARGRTVPGNRVRLQCGHPPEQRQVMARRGRLHAGHHPVPLGFGDHHRGGRGVARRVAEGGVPQHVVPVRMGGPAGDGAQAPRGELAGQAGQLGDMHARVDDQAAAVGTRDHHGIGGRERARRDENTGRDFGEHTASLLAGRELPPDELLAVLGPLVSGEILAESDQPQDLSSRGLEVGLQLQVHRVQESARVEGGSLVLVEERDIEVVTDADVVLLIAFARDLAAEDVTIEPANPVPLCPGNPDRRMISERYLCHDHSSTTTTTSTCLWRQRVPVSCADGAIGWGVRRPVGTIGILATGILAGGIPARVRSPG